VIKTRYLLVVLITSLAAMVTYAELRWHNGKWHFVSSNGKRLTAPAFDVVRPFHDGMAAVSTGVQDKGFFESSGPWGFVNASGELVVPPQYGAVQNFSQGYAAVRKNGRWGFIDKSGTVVIAAQFAAVRPFRSDGRAAVTASGGRWGQINQEGEYIIEPQYDSAPEFKNGYALVHVLPRKIDGPESGGTCGWIDESTDWVISPSYVNGGDAQCGLFAVQTVAGQTGPDDPGKWGVVDRNEDIVINPRYDYIDICDDVIVAYQMSDAPQTYDIYNHDGSPLACIEGAGYCFQFWATPDSEYLLVQAGRETTPRIYTRDWEAVTDTDVLKSCNSQLATLTNAPSDRRNDPTDAPVCSELGAQARRLPTLWQVIESEL